MSCITYRAYRDRYRYDKTVPIGTLKVLNFLECRLMVQTASTDFRLGYECKQRLLRQPTKSFAHQKKYQRRSKIKEFHQSSQRLAFY